MDEKVAGRAESQRRLAERTAAKEEKARTEAERQRKAAKEEEARAETEIQKRQLKRRK